MKLQKQVLSFYTVVFMVFAAPALAAPEWFAHLLKYDISQAGATMEFIAAYGGLLLGIGLFLIYCLKNDVRLGLIAVMLTVGGLFAARVFGIFFDEGINTIQSTFLVLETLTLMLVGVLLKPETPIQEPNYG